MARSKVHLVVCAFPALGHINPLLHFSTLLAAKGFWITFVTTQFFCDRLRSSRRLSTHKGQVQEALAAEAKQNGQERQIEGPLQKVSAEEGGGAAHGQEEEGSEAEGRIIFEGLADGLPSKFDRTSPSTELSRAVDDLRYAFEELMHSLMHSGAPIPSLIISDAFLPWAQDVAASFKIPGALFWPLSVAVFTIFTNTDLLLSNGISPFEDDLNAGPIQIIDFLPGVPSLPTSHLPHRVKRVGGQDRRFLLSENLAKQSEQWKQVKWVVANSFDSLEGPLLYVLQNNLGVSVKLVGPLLPSPYAENQRSEYRQEEELGDVLQWLDGRAVSSVLYISLGTVATWTHQQVMEVGLGLLAKKQAFLWVMRPWEMRLALPEGVLKLGKVVEFAPQLQVLRHPATGGFMSHCGWNSTLESLSTGVPILAWPRFFDQFTNCWYVVNVWKVGVELQAVRRVGIEEPIVDRGEVERALTLLMQAEDGRVMRSRASKIRDSAGESVSFGSSHENVESLLSKLLLDSTAT